MPSPSLLRPRRLLVAALLLLSSTLSAAVDLVVTSVVAVPAQFSAGTSVQFDVTVKNQGNTAAAATNLQVQVDVSGAYATYGTQWQGALAAGASATVRTVAWTANSASLAVSAKVDYANYYAESNEANNTLALTLASTSGGGGGGGNTGTGRFRISGTKILKPNGTEFIPLGVNVNGWNFQDWPGDIYSTAQIDALTKQWKFNLIRANLYFKAPTWNGATTAPAIHNNETNAYAAIDQLVNTYTSRGLVVMLEIHDLTGDKFPGDAAFRSALRTFWKNTALRYKSNSYVWFNLLNEPGSYDNGVPALYRDVHRDLIAGIRDDAQADNIIIVDGTQWGQDCNNADNSNVPEANSGILRYGPEIISYNNKTYSNVAFSIHMYGLWNGMGVAGKLRNYIDRVRAKNLCLLVGEVGGNGDTWDYNTTDLAYHVALKEKGVGLVAWHWAPYDNYRLVTGGGATRGWQINSPTNPTNLSSWFGYYFWRATHVDGYGLQ